jgi:exodeoxyribonuclease VII small subunit
MRQPHMAKKTPSPFNFESALSELNEIVERMEQGNLNLEASLKDFEKGVALTRQCQTALQSAEQQVKILLEKNGEQILSPYMQDTKENE